jgi:hypothetical protein
MNINPKNSENALKLIQTELEEKTAMIGDSLNSFVVYYALSASETTAPESGWSPTAPDHEDGKYMWQKTVTTKNDGTVSSTVTCVQGADGSSIVLNDCTITDSGTALSVTAGADTEDGQLAQAVIDAFDYATAKDILEV